MHHPIATRTVSVPALVICMYCDISRIFRRSVRSATTPPMIVNRKMGSPARKLIQPQQACRMAQPVNQPALRHNLHPGTNTRGTGPDPHQAKIAIVKCFEYSAQC